MFIGLAFYGLWIKAFHVISVIAWMAGQLYLPRLFVYHCQVKTGTEEDKRFQLMEYRLLRYIINPAMMSTFLFGTLLALTPGMVNWHAKWWIVKLTCLFLLTGYHGFCSIWRRRFAKGQNRYSAKFYRWMNEVPTILMIIIVIMVIVQPF